MELSLEPEDTANERSGAIFDPGLLKAISILSVVEFSELIKLPPAGTYLQHDRARP
jgi:hypothetical protein